MHQADRADWDRLPRSAEIRLAETAPRGRIRIRRFSRTPPTRLREQMPRTHPGLGQAARRPARTRAAHRRPELPLAALPGRATQPRTRIILLARLSAADRSWGW